MPESKEELSTDRGECPRRSVGRLKETVSVRVIGKLSLLVIPIEFVAGAVRNITHMGDHSSISSDLNVAYRCFAALYTVDKVLNVFGMVLFVGSL
jgi:hypothetical protein